MKESMSETLRSDALPAEVAREVVLDISGDIAEAIVQLREQFAGRVVRWTSDDRKEENVWAWALENTEIFPTQRKALRSELETQGLVEKQSKTLWVRFNVLTRD